MVYTLVGGEMVSTKGIAGTGIDMVDVDRFALAVRRRGNRLWQRLFTLDERRLAPGRRGRDQFYAGRFAAKEAVLKALGTGLGAARWHDVEIRRGESGEPVVMLHRVVAERARRAGITRVMVSISHTRSHAVASAVAIRH